MSSGEQDRDHAGFSFSLAHRSRRSATVVVGTDGSVHDDPSLRYAAAEAARLDAALVLVKGYPGSVDPGDCDFGTFLQVARGRHELQLIEALSRALDVGYADLPDHRIVCADVPHHRLLAAVGAQAQLIVCAARGLGSRRLARNCAANGISLVNLPGSG